MNRETQQQRLDLVRAILGQFGLEATEISPIDYQESFPFPYNNFIYRISLAHPATASHFPGVQSCTGSPADGGVSTVVIRLSNPNAEGLSQVNRTENEVAAIHLTRLGLQSDETRTAKLSDVVPVVYAWHPAGEDTGGFGWLVMDFKPGVALSEVFSELSDERKRDVIGQLADLFAGVQRAPLPDALKGHYGGGLTITSAGEIVSGRATTSTDGPWSDLAALWKSKLAAQLKTADESDLLRGWQEGGLREAIDEFVCAGIDGLFEKAGVDVYAQGLIHGDFTTWNALFDRETNKLTGLVDFDFASVSHPGMEFFSSFGDIGGGLGNVPGPDPSEGLLREAVLTGVFEGVDVPEEARSKWTVARMWDDALRARGLLRPSDIAGMRALCCVMQLEMQIAPPRLLHPVYLKGKMPEEIVEGRRAGEEGIRATLAGLV